MAIFNGDSLDIGSSFMGRKSRKRRRRRGHLRNVAIKKVADAETLLLILLLWAENGNLVELSGGGGEDD